MPSFSVVCARLLGLEVATERLDQRLADQQFAEILQVGQRIEREQALHQRVGMLHLADRLLVLLLGHALEAPVLEHPVVHEVLVDRSELILQLRLEKTNDERITLHANAFERSERDVLSHRFCLRSSAESRGVSGAPRVHRDANRSRSDANASRSCHLLLRARRLRRSGTLAGGTLAGPTAVRTRGSETACGRPPGARPVTCLNRRRKNAASS